NLLYCDSANLGSGYSIPWKTQIKLAVTYPLPWFGLSVNGSYQGLPGYTIAATTLGSSGVLKSSTYVTCPGTSAAAGCTPLATIIPGQIATTLSAQLDPSNTTLTP